MKPYSAPLGYLQTLFLFCLLFNHVEKWLEAEQTQINYRPTYYSEDALLIPQA